VTSVSAVPAITLTTAHTGASSKANELGMRPMQERVWAHRGEQYLLIKSPPASGKSRALMFIALDKLHNQITRQAIIVVPERSIGGSFADAPLMKSGFFWDWVVKPHWNLCNAPGVDDVKVAKSKVRAVSEFLTSDDEILVCTHATFRFAIEELGIDAFDGRLIAVDEFHHVSANPDNRLGSQLGQLIARDKVHLVAMTGSYFRGDAVAVLAPEDEAKFTTVTYTYYEQLNGYEYLKTLEIAYSFYTGRYVDKINDLLDPAVKTIVHIPSVNSRESTKDKHREVEEIMDHLGRWVGSDPETGFQLIETADKRTIRVADLVDDDPAKRDRVSMALKSSAARTQRDFVDIVIALGMAKEGFDWIWCEHALTVGYRSSLTEVVQIIGRATRDAPGKTVARFTNLIAEPAAADDVVADAVNDTLKAIAASLLMEQVLAPRFEFTPKDIGPKQGYDYGPDGYNEGQSNVGFDAERGQFHFELKGLVEPTTQEARRICQEDLNEVIVAFVQDKTSIERGMFDPETAPEELTQVRMGRIVRERYPELSETDQEAIRQHAIATLNVTQQASKIIAETVREEGGELKVSTAFVDGVRKFMNVRELDVDLIDHINPFDAAVAILAKVMNEATLRQVQAAISARRTHLSEEDARAFAVRAVQWKRERGRAPDIGSHDPWERQLAEGVAAFARFKAKTQAAADA
jgi:superfamily II DNA or RNA helicase